MYRTLVCISLHMGVGGPRLLRYFCLMSSLSVASIIQVYSTTRSVTTVYILFRCVYTGGAVKKQAEKDDDDDDDKKEDSD